MTTSTTNTDVKYRTITMTNRAPVKIREDEWVVIASATGDSYVGQDYGRYQQSLSRNELDLYVVKVRRHRDGRHIVSAVFNAATAWTGSEDHRGGCLLPNGDDLAAHIREVGQECGIPDGVIRACIADLPAEAI